MARFYYILNGVLVGFSILALCFFLDVSTQLTFIFFFVSCLVLSLFLLAYKSSFLTLNIRFSWINLLAIAVVSLFSLQEVTALFDQNNRVDMIRVTPLIICLVGLYFSYWFVNFIESSVQKDMDANRLISGVFSGLSVTLACLMALPVTVFVLLFMMMSESSLLQDIIVKFTERGFIPPLTLFIFVWSLILITNKFFVLYVERYAFKNRQHKSRIFLAFALFRCGNNEVSDSQREITYFTDLIWKTAVDFYTLPRYINWAIPILGFIGTVLGISLAAEGIQKILINQQDVQEMTRHLGDAVSPLGIAFDTTLIALSLSVFLVLLQTALQRFEHALMLDIENEFRNK